MAKNKTPAELAAEEEAKIAAELAAEEDAEKAKLDAEEKAKLEAEEAAKLKDAELLEKEEADKLKAEEKAEKTAVDLLKVEKEALSKKNFEVCVTGFFAFGKMFRAYDKINGKTYIDHVGTWLKEGKIKEVKKGKK